MTDYVFVDPQERIAELQAENQILRNRLAARCSERNFWLRPVFWFSYWVDRVAGAWYAGKHESERRDWRA